MPDATASDGLVRARSATAVPATIERVRTAAAEAGFAVVACIDHAAGAASAGLTLRPTTLLLLANPKGGTPLMQLDQTIGIELPLRVLVWEDVEGITWVAMVDPRALAARHRLGKEAEAPLARMQDTVSRILARAAAS